MKDRIDGPKMGRLDGTLKVLIDRPVIYYIDGSMKDYIDEALKGMFMSDLHKILFLGCEAKWA